MKTSTMRSTAGLAALLAASHLYAGAQCRATGVVKDSSGNVTDFPHEAAPSV